ncbi:uracil DNA N-glycosylase Thp1 [Coemansia sp. Benny D115]|nr:uracil DNA N-glycosylase Thp1 [Coemansia sp. Benny D115]
MDEQQQRISSTRCCREAARRRSHSPDTEPSTNKTPPQRRSPPSKAQRRPTASEIAGYAPIPEDLRPNLDILFVGINPGIVSGQKQRHFGNPQNYFWRGLYESGLTPRLLHPDEGSRLLFSTWNMSIVNLVQRTTASTSDLSRKEMRDAVPELLRKIRDNPPRIACFVGIGIYDAFAQAIKSDSGGDGDQVRVVPGGSTHSKRLGLLDTLLDVGGHAVRLFVMPSTSGRTRSYQNAEKLMHFRQLKYVRDCICSVASPEHAPNGIDQAVLDALGPHTASKYFSTKRSNKEHR